MRVFFGRLLFLSLNIGGVRTEPFVVLLTGVLAFETRKSRESESPFSLERLTSNRGSPFLEGND